MAGDVSRDPAAATIEALTTALTRVGDALVAVDADALVAAEDALAASLSALSGIGDAGDRAAAMAACGRARVALLRCRRLGVSLATAMRAEAPVPDAYTRVGAYVDARLASTVIDARL